MNYNVQYIIYEVIPFIVINKENREKSSSKLLSYDRYYEHETVLYPFYG